MPVIDCKSGERTHLIAEEYLAAHPQLGSGVFMVLVARAPATTWDVQRAKGGVIRNLAKKQAFVNNYSFHILDPEWGHLTIKMAGHPPFGAQVILNGHKHVACQARAAGIAFRKDGNCFTEVADPQGLAQVADTLSHDAATGRLGQVLDRYLHGVLVLRSRPRRPGTLRVPLQLLRDQVIGPIVAGVRSPGLGRKPTSWTTVDRRYETLRVDMEALFSNTVERQAG